MENEVEKWLGLHLEHTQFNKEHGDQFDKIRQQVYDCLVSGYIQKLADLGDGSAMSADEMMQVVKGETESAGYELSGLTQSFIDTSVCSDDDSLEVVEIFNLENNGSFELLLDYNFPNFPISNTPLNVKELYII